MAVIDHIKIASAELMKAAQLVKIEIENLRKQETESRINLDTQIANSLRQINHFEYELNHAENPFQRSQAQSAIVQLQRRIASMRSELREQQRNIDNAISQKQGMVNGLESQARSMM